IEAFNSGKTLKDITRKLDQIFNIWNSIFTNRKILYKDKKIQIQVVPEELYYDIENLSDGERSALYVMIKVLQSETNSTIIIDEPEIFLNPSILNHLFDECEKIKPESNFLYLSHNLEFVTTRKDNTLFWIKDYKYPDSWTVNKIDSEDVPDELILKV